MSLEPRDLTPGTSADAPHDLPRLVRALATAPDLMDALPERDRQALLDAARRSLPPHPFETRIMASPDELFAAVARAGDFTVRMIRGVIAEYAFARDVVAPIAPAWREKLFDDERPYDFLLTDDAASATSAIYHGAVDVRVQVKMQRSFKPAARRSTSGAGARAAVAPPDRMPNPVPAPAQWKTLRLGWPADYWVAELQKSRQGQKRGKQTRPLAAGGFDILAVSLGPSTKCWADFAYTPERWLLRDPTEPDSLLTFQPVAARRTAGWTPDLLECIDWLRRGPADRPDGEPAGPSTAAFRAYKARYAHRRGERTDQPNPDDALADVGDASAEGPALPRPTRRARTRGAAPEHPGQGSLF